MLHLQGTRNIVIFAVAHLILGGILATLFQSLFDKEEHTKAYEAGTCVDHSAWVGDSRQLNGNYYTKVVEPALNEGWYIVNKCKYEDGVETCDELQTQGLDDYEWIHCPK